MLLDSIYGSLPHMIRVKLRLPVNEKTQSFISWVYEKAHVSDISYDDYVTLSVECNAGIKDKIVSKCQNLQGMVI